LATFFVWLLYPFTLMVHLWLAAPKPSREASVLFASFSCALTLLALTLIWQREIQAYGNDAAACLIMLATLRWQLRKHTSRFDRRAQLIDMAARS
jgi:hypothetical protein